MEEKLKKFLRKNIYYIIYGLIFGAFILVGYEIFGDDFGVRGKMMPNLLEEFENLSRSYEGWSSRILINPPIWIMMHFPIWVWGSITTLLAVYIFWAIDRLLFNNQDIKATYVMLLLFLLFPMDILCDVGWVVTTMSYMWPMAAAVGSCYSIRRFLDGKSIKWQYSIFLCLCTIYAANKEELSIMLLLIFGAFLIISVKEKKLNTTILLQTAISVGSVLFHMFSGGNAGRQGVNNTYGYKDTFYDKVEIGLTQTPLRLFLKYDYMCLVFSVMLMLIIFIKYKSFLVRVVSVIPVAVWIFGSLGNLALSDGIIDTAAYDTPMFCYELSISRGKYTHSMAWIMLLCSVIVLSCMVYTAMKCASDKKTALLSFLLLAAAYGGRATTGFAYAGWGLYGRTYIFMYYVFVVLVAIYIQAVMRELPDKKTNIIMNTLMVFALMGIFRNIVTIGII